MSDTDLIVRRDGPIAELVLNRPAAMNALNRDLITALIDTVSDLANDTELRAIILTGNGRAFCAGVDLKELAQSTDVKENLTWTGPTSLFDVMRASPHPIICAVNGFAVTGGLELALMGDFLIAAQSARFADTHARVGITPSWGMTQILPRLIGLNRARQMSLTGEFVEAQTALAWGLVNEVHPLEGLLPRARALATQIAETDRDTMIKIRTLMADSAELLLGDGLTREVGVFGDHIGKVTPEEVDRNRARVTDRGRTMTRRG
ncbi:MAG: enoyl-CoA hydratase [Sedimentitalea sp.]